MNFDDLIDDIYPIEFEIKDTIDTAKSASYIDLHLNIATDRLLWTKKYHIRRLWRYQRGNQNMHIEGEQTTPSPKEKGQKDQQRSKKHTYKAKDRVTKTH